MTNYQKKSFRRRLLHPKIFIAENPLAGKGKIYVFPNNSANFQATKMADPISDSLEQALSDTTT